MFKRYHLSTMQSLLTVAAFLSLGLLIYAQPADADSNDSKGLEFQSNTRHEVTLEFRQFAQPSDFVDHNQDGSLSWQGRYEFNWLGKQRQDNLTIVPFARYNSIDSERSRLDLQSFSWTRVRGNWELRSGIRTVSWRTTEAIHLVDIINQTDLTGDVDGEDKLGQAMINILWNVRWGSLELFALPAFRERIFAGDDARLRSAFEFATNDVRYESGAEQWRTDFAARATVFLGDWELAISHFSGTSREPVLQFENNQLRPFYPVIEQTGLELQYAAGDWLWKFEGVSRGGFTTPNAADALVNPSIDNRYEAAAFGFEYTWSGLGDTGYDLGVLSEYLWDGRRAELFANDLFIGVRLGLNDIQSTDMLIGSIADLDHEEYLSFVEFSRRIGETGRLDLTVRFFDAAGDQLTRMRDADFFELHNDDYASLTYTYYY